MISVVCPFYNEEAILEIAVNKLIKNLLKLNEEWELIIVNDGSTDNSEEIAYSLQKKYSQLHLLSYPIHHGRGYAIKKGIEKAKGDIVITTEIDLSWGDDIVERIYRTFQENPDVDIVIASPHLPGGGFKNVPISRIILSKLGNYIIRLSLRINITMNTGMTRGYKKEKFLILPLSKYGKEMHLEIIAKAKKFGYKIYEIPAIIDWLGSITKRKKEKSIKSLIQTIKEIWFHILLCIAFSHFRYVFCKKI